MGEEELKLVGWEEKAKNDGKKRQSWWLSVVMRMEGKNEEVKEGTNGQTKKNQIVKER